MKEQVKGIIYDFKNAGWTVQKVEQELKFSNGTIGKVLNGKAGMSDFKFTKLLGLHQETFKKTPTVTEGLKEEIEKNNLPENKEKILADREEIHDKKIDDGIDAWRTQELITQYEQELTTLPDKGQFANQRRKWLQSKIYQLKFKL